MRSRDIVVVFWGLTLVVNTIVGDISTVSTSRSLGLLYYQWHLTKYKIWLRHFYSSTNQISIIPSWCTCIYHNCSCILQLLNKRNANDINLTFFQGVVTSEMCCRLFIQGFCQEPGSWLCARLELPANRLLHSLSLNANACGPRTTGISI